MGPWDGWHMSPMWGWGGMLLGGLMMLLFWGGIIALAFFAIRWILGSSRSAAGRVCHASQGSLPWKY